MLLPHWNTPSHSEPREELAAYAFFRPQPACLSSLFEIEQHFGDNFGDLFFLLSDLENVELGVLENVEVVEAEDEHDEEDCW